MTDSQEKLLLTPKETPLLTSSSQMKDGQFHRFRSLTRLIIGGLEVGTDELFQRLQAWEAELARGDEDSGQAESETALEALPDPAGALDAPGGQTPDETVGSLLRLALIGFLFESQDRFGKNLDTIKKTGSAVQRFTGSVLRPVHSTPLFAPVTNRWEALVGRGESEVSRWIELGRREEANSRRLANLAFDDSVDHYIDYLTSNPEVQELVQTQSTGLAAEMIEEVRERTVSADTFLESLARSVLRRVPRSASSQTVPSGQPKGIDR